MPNSSSNIYLPHLNHCVFTVVFTARVLGGEGVEMSSWLDGHSFSGAHHYHYFLILLATYYPTERLAETGLLC